MGQKHFLQLRQAQLLAEPLARPPLISGELGRGAVCAKPELFQLVLDGQVDDFFGVNFAGFLALHLKHSGDDFPAGFTTMDLKAVFDQFGAFFGACHWNEYPFILLQTVQSLEFSVRHPDRMSIVVHGIHPWLFAHGSAGVVEKNAQLVGANNCPHVPYSIRLKSGSVNGIVQEASLFSVDLDISS